MKIVNLLKNKGYTIWMDESGIETGEQFKKVIVNAIEECNVLVFFSSKHSNTSPWTAKEIGVANSKGKPILPVKLDETEYNKEVLFDLVNLDYCDLTRRVQRDEQIESLLKSLSKLIDTVDPSIVSNSIRHRRKYYKCLSLAMVTIICIIVAALVYLKFSRIPDITIIPQRGAILDEYGRKLAYTQELFDVYVDKSLLLGIDDKRLKDFSGQIAKILSDGRNAYQYYSCLIDGNSRYLNVAKNASDSLVNALASLPVLMDKQYSKALICQSIGERIYPYGNLFSDVVGVYPCDSSKQSGIEYNLNSILSGVVGKTHKTRKLSLGLDRTIPPKAGFNIRTTINVEFQQLVDSLLAFHINQNEIIEAASVMILESDSGAIRAMVSQDTSNSHSTTNFDYLFSSETGSTFQTITLSALLEEKGVRLNESLPTNHGRILEYPILPTDAYVENYERKNQTSTISVLDGFTMSSNYVFRRLILDHYERHPDDFIETLHKYKIDFPVELGIEPTNKSARIIIPDPSQESWRDVDLLSLAIGYNVQIPAINILTFYNVIANNGILIEPNLIEAYEDNGNIVKRTKRASFKKPILSIKTVDSLKYALSMVNRIGTGRRINETPIAGKTGTTRLRLTDIEREGSMDPYMDINGRHKYMATYIGFFPVDSPKYTIYASFRTKLTNNNLYGGTLPASITEAIIEEICTWNPSLEEKGNLTQ